MDCGHIIGEPDKRGQEVVISDQIIVQSFIIHETDA